MTECDRIRADAPGLAALHPYDPERVAAESHARGCAGCARALREAGRLQALIAACEPPPIPAGALERASREIAAELRREARRRVIGSVVAVCASVLVFVGFARNPSRSLFDWTLAAVLWAFAVVLAVTASRKPLLTTALAVLAGVAAASISGAPGNLAALLGLECLATEVASAAIVVGAVWLALRGGTTSPPRPAIAAAAAAGALAGDAALQVTCSAHTALPHVMAFHVGGILIAAAAASVLWRAAAGHRVNRARSPGMP
jgi:hypothetical protein